MSTLNDIDSDDFFQKGLAEQVQDILDENVLLKEEVRQLNSAIIFLRQELEKNGVIFQSPLTKSPTKMTQEELQEELLEANKGVIARMKPRAAAVDAIAMPTPVETFKSFLDDGLNPEEMTKEEVDRQAAVRMLRQLIKSQEESNE
jgi:hypothetical protein